MEQDKEDLGVTASSGGRSAGPSDPSPSVSAVPAAVANAIRVATAALSGRIFAGRPTKDGMGFREPRHDVTSDVLKAIAEHIGMDREATVHCDGQPAYIISVKSIDSRRADVAAEQDALEQYVAEYEMCCDEGYYAPTEHERGLIQDALQGWLVHRADLVADARAALSKAEGR